MKYIDEYGDEKLARGLAAHITQMLKGRRRKIRLMEVCGTHTMAIFRSGLHRLLPQNLLLLSGPGCPVCVTPNHYLDKAIAYARRNDIIITSFGDMIKVPGSTTSLEKERGRQGNVQVLYSALDALKVAENNPDKKIIFLGIGFETTAPTLAATIKMAKKMGRDNYFVYSGHKLIPPAMRALLNAGELNIDGFICPGHVSTIIGSRPYEFISRDYRLPCVIAGFEPLDILQAIYMLVKQIINRERPRVEIQYKRCVKEEGNPKAQRLMEEVFAVSDAEWRGMGSIPASGLKIRKKYKSFDAQAHIAVKVEPVKAQRGCICGEILRGIKRPWDCPLFRRACTPENPLGACMVSSEGTCAAFYRYGK